MRILTRALAFVLFIVMACSGTMPVFAQTGMVSTGVISGTITDTAGAPVSGATIALRGPVTRTTTSGARGHFQIALPQGIYAVLVRAGGFAEASDETVTLTPSGVSVDFRLQRPTFSSLETIGSTTTTGGSGGPQFNTSAAARTVVSNQTFEDQGATQVRDVLNEIPGIVISTSNGSANGGSPGAITTPNIRGGLSYETASLIDGHPVSVGKYGDYVTTFLSSFMFQSIEVDKGPGSIPSQIARSVNGTVNFRTWDPTSKPTGEAEFGVDGWGGKFANLRFSDSMLDKKLGFVFDVATDGTPGPSGIDSPQSFIANLTDVSYHDSAGIPVSVSPVTELHAPGATNSYTGLATNTIGCCVNIPTNYLNRSELGKVRLNFSEVTSFTATMMASQTWSSQNGNVQNVVPTTFAPTAPNASIASGTLPLFYPYNDNFAQDYEFNNEPIYEAEFHTSVKNDNVLARFYSATIDRLQSNSDTNDTPLTVPVYLYGQTSGGAPLNGTDAFGNPYIATITDPLYQSDEHDNLTGYSFEYDHDLGTTGNVITFSADENYSATHVFTPGEPDNSSTSNIPAGSQQNTATYLLRGQFQIGPKLNVTAGYYLTRLDTNFAVFPTSSTYTFSNDLEWHNDERMGAAYRLNPDTSLRFSLGSALVPPFLGILSGSSSMPAVCTTSNCPSGYQPGTVAVNSVGGLNIRPETSFGYDLGADYRFPKSDAMVFSGDLYLTNLQNQFLKTVYGNGIATIDGTAYPLFTTAYANLSNARYEGIEISLQRAPVTGLGFIVAGDLQRGYPYNVPPSIYQYNAKGIATTNQGIVPYLNFGPTTLVSSGGSAIPYSKGSAEINYRGGSGFYANLGASYYGPNNTYNEPAFAVVRSTIRVPVVNPYSYLQASVNNLFNTYGSTFDEAYRGVQETNIGGQYYATGLKGYGPRNFTFEFVIKH